MGQGVAKSYSKSQVIYWIYSCTEYIYIPTYWRTKYINILNHYYKEELGI
jgi:hypothetical protein